MFLAFFNQKTRIIKTTKHHRQQQLYTNKNKLRKTKYKIQKQLKSLINTREDPCWNGCLETKSTRFFFSKKKKRREVLENKYVGLVSRCVEGRLTGDWLRICGRRHFLKEVDGSRGCFLCRAGGRNKGVGCEDTKGLSRRYRGGCRPDSW